MAALQGSYSRERDANNTEDRLWKGISLKMLDTDHRKQVCDSLHQNLETRQICTNATKGRLVGNMIGPTQNQW